MSADSATRQRVARVRAGAFEVVINYRREDTSGHAGRLYDALAEHFGSEHVFMDIDVWGA
jgi:bisphosphoglycerate-independent phosphoglycerate mutase (AlkP superfamily)